MLLFWWNAICSATCPVMWRSRRAQTLMPSNSVLISWRFNVSFGENLTSFITSKWIIGSFICFWLHTLYGWNCNCSKWVSASPFSKLRVPLGGFWGVDLLTSHKDTRPHSAMERLTLCPPASLNSCYFSHLEGQMKRCFFNCKLNWTHQENVKKQHPWCSV